MKETKNEFIKVRVSSSEKEQIKSYCENHNITISELIRMACLNKIQKESN